MDRRDIHTKIIIMITEMTEEFLMNIPTDMVATRIDLTQDLDQGKDQGPVQELVRIHIQDPDREQDPAIVDIPVLGDPDIDRLAVHIRVLDLDQDLGLEVLAVKLETVQTHDRRRKLSIIVHVASLDL